MMGGGGSGGFESSGGLGTTFSPSSSSSYAPPPADGSSSAPRAFAYSSDRGIVVEPAAIPAAIRSLVLRLWLFGRHALYSLTSLVRLQRRGGASRAVALGVTLLLALATLSLFSLAGYRPFFLPPSYAEESHRETYLPQVHPATQTPAERSPHARYVAFAPIKETGFNYQLQSLIIQQVVAFESNRSLAFEPYHVVDSVSPFPPPRRMHLVLHELWRMGSTRQRIEEMTSPGHSGRSQALRMPSISRARSENAADRGGRPRRVLLEQAEVRDKGRVTFGQPGESRMPTFWSWKRPGHLDGGDACVGWKRRLAEVGLA